MREKWSSECWEVRFITDTVSLLLLSSWRPLSELLNTKGDVIACCCVAREAERPFISCELENVPRRWRQMKIHRKDFDSFFVNQKKKRTSKQIRASSRPEWSRQQLKISTKFMQMKQQLGGKEKMENGAATETLTASFTSVTAGAVHHIDSWEKFV